MDSGGSLPTFPMAFVLGDASTRPTMSLDTEEDISHMSAREVIPPLGEGLRHMPLRQRTAMDLAPAALYVAFGARNPAPLPLRIGSLNRLPPI